MREADQHVGVNRYIGVALAFVIGVAAGAVTPSILRTGAGCVGGAIATRAPGARRADLRATRAPALVAVRPSENGAIAATAPFESPAAPEAPVSRSARPVASASLDKPSPRLEGAVILPDEWEIDREHAPWIEVYVVRTDAMNVPAEDLPSLGRRDLASPGDRRYRFDDLLPGRYFVGAALDHGPILASRSVDVPEDGARCDLSISLPGALASVVVHAVGPAGEDIPLDGMSAWASSKAAQSAACPVVQGRRGTAWILPDPWFLDAWRNGADAGASLSVELKCAGFGRKRVDIPRGALEVTIQLGDAATLEATLVGAPASFANFVVTLAPRGAPIDVADILEAETSRTGAFRLGPVQPGDYDVVLLAIVGRIRLPICFEAARVPIALHPGENALTIPVPPLSQLTVHAEAGANMRLFPTAEGRPDLPWLVMEGRCDASGVVTFRGLPAGTFTISAGGDEMDVLLPDQSDVSFEAMRGANQGVSPR